MNKSLLFLVLIIVCNEVSAQTDTVFVKDMYSSWQTFDDEGSSVPYFEQKRELIFFELPALDSGSLLKISARTPFDIWVNGQMFMSQFEGSRFIDLDSVATSFINHPTITFYGEDWREGDLSTELYEQIEMKRAVVYGRIESYGQLDRNSFLIVLILVILMAGIYRKFFPGTFSKSYNSPLSLKLRGLDAQDNYQGFLSFDNLMAIFYLSLMGSFLSYYLGFQMITLGIHPKWQITVPIVILVAIIASFLLIGKYLWSLLISYIFQFKDLPNVQNQDFVHFLILLTSIGLGLAALDYSVYSFTSDFLRSTVIMIFVIMLIFFQFWMILKLDKLYTHRKLMIISYLCTTEFLPSFIVIAWLWKS